jgi:hypothetical protein
MQNFMIQVSMVKDEAELLGHASPFETSEN